MRGSYKILLLGSAALALTGCTQHKLSLHEGYGNSLKHNMAAQIANPAPTYEGPATSSGAKAAIAMERYKTDKVEDLVILRTTTVGNSGGGG